ncbi:hypothetical protein ACFYVL_41880 [Streptomyces sp. NPDC004111]|uniref:hypothetical protein n=1 Tax=Streptomyces sp. NPDC004111 TaxID=3364690 RepID=UPI003682F35B
MLRRISIALAGLMAVGFIAASPAAAHTSDIHGCWVNKTHAQAGSVVVDDFDAGCWHVG